jgi:hypothetical protein
MSLITGKKIKNTHKPRYCEKQMCKANKRMRGLMWPYGLLESHKIFFYNDLFREKKVGAF